MKNSKQESTLIGIQEFRVFFDDDVMFTVCGKRYYYLRVYALSDQDAIRSARTLFPWLTVRCVVKLDIWDGIGVT